MERLRAELAPRRWTGDAIAMGTNTDPYQRCEGIYGLTKGLIQVLPRPGRSTQASTPPRTFVGR
ncbi:hypothetical protein BH24ACT2_BH24ACT2_00640 [soil metagenome]